ncbi:MAG: nitrous oxide reductase accessory protein NosL [Alphaproteobacteria bacterium]|nr:nitrous oxide reductase accessory protein NosL [Alphaproteobacteria bacterium]
MKRLALVLLLLAGCGEEEAALPDPVRLTAEAVGHYCMMTVLDHEGPKAQIHLEGIPEPIFFTQVRDALAYAKGPERSAGLRAIYVSDMGAPEIVPFSSAEAAARFAGRHGGKVRAFADIPDDAVLAPVEIDLAEGGRQ